MATMTLTSTSTTQVVLQECPNHQPKSRNAKKKAQKPPRAAPPPAPKLCDQISQGMVDKLVQDLQASHGTPTLIDRLKTLGVINVQSTLSSTQNVVGVPTQNRQPGPYANSNLGPVQSASSPSIHSGSRTSTSTRSSATSRGSREGKTSSGGYRTFTLGDFAAVQALSGLSDAYGRVGHMGILDDSYQFFITKNLDAALYFKVKDNICLVGGDPLGPEELLPDLLKQFARYRRKHNWGMIFVGASDTFLAYAKEQGWTTIQFGNERVLNPVTNPVLREEQSKRIASQNRQLLNPAKGGHTIGIYNPSIAENLQLQQQLVAVYDSWRDARNSSEDPQAFITVYDPFAIPGLMTYIYTMDRTGTPNGFAALRRIGANNGYHVDPCIAAPDAARGISDLLIFSSMALLNAAGCTYLSFGYEPLSQAGEISGMPSWMQDLTRKAQKSVIQGLKVSGKKTYHDKWCPEEAQTTGLHLIFADGMPGLQDIFAVMHFANISVKELAKAKLKKVVSRKMLRKESSEEEVPEVPEKPSSGEKENKLDLKTINGMIARVKERGSALAASAKASPMASTAEL